MPPNAEQPLVISVARAAALLGRTRRELYSWLARGAIPDGVAFRSGRAWWILRARLEEWAGLRNGAGPGPASAELDHKEPPR